jgi:hypothetical protein
MSLRIFDETVETVESPQQLDVSFGARILFSAWAALVAIIPAITTAYCGLAMTRVFRSMTSAEDASSAVIFDSLHSFNRPVVITLGISAILSFAMALILATNPKARLASVGLPFSIVVPIIAALPAVILWFAETTTLDVLTGKITNASVQETAQTIGNLFFSAIALGLLAQGVAFICAIVSLFIPLRKRNDPFSLRRAFVWAVSGTLLLVFSIAYFVLI